MTRADHIAKAEEFLERAEHLVGTAAGSDLTALGHAHAAVAAVLPERDDVASGNVWPDEGAA